MTQEMPKHIWALPYPDCEYSDTSKQAEYLAEIKSTDLPTKYTRSDIADELLGVLEKVQEICQLRGRGPAGEGLADLIDAAIKKAQGE